MNAPTLMDLQPSLQDSSAFDNLEDYVALCRAFLTLIERIQPTRIVSPTTPNYIFYQYDAAFRHRITRPLNSDLFIEPEADFQAAAERFVVFLDDLRRRQEAASTSPGGRRYVATKEINKVVYTIQQALGGIADSFDSVNQARKRVGSLFEKLVKLLIKRVGLECEPRIVKIPPRRITSWATRSRSTAWTASIMSIPDRKCWLMNGCAIRFTTFSTS